MYSIKIENGQIVGVSVGAVLDGHTEITDAEYQQYQESKIGCTYEIIKGKLVITPPDAKVLAAQAVQQAKAAKTAEINNLAQAYIDHATGADKLPAFEVQSWAIQGAEAKAWKADPSAPTPTLDTIANARGLPLDALRAGAYKKAMLYEGLVAAVTGQRQKYNDLLRAAKTAEEVNAIIVVYGAA